MILLLFATISEADFIFLHFGHPVVLYKLQDSSQSPSTQHLGLLCFMSYTATYSDR